MTFVYNLNFLICIYKSRDSDLVIDHEDDKIKFINSDDNSLIVWYKSIGYSMLCNTINKHRSYGHVEHLRFYILLYQLFYSIDMFICCYEYSIR